MAFLDEDSHPGAKGCGCVLDLLWLGTGVFAAGIISLGHGPCEHDPGRTCGMDPIVPLVIIAMGIALGTATRWLVGQIAGGGSTMVRWLGIFAVALLVAMLACSWIGLLVL